IIGAGYQPHILPFCGFQDLGDLYLSPSPYPSHVSQNLGKPCYPGEELRTDMLGASSMNTSLALGYCFRLHLSPCGSLR
uniref:Uncharacterized protein n=1 Tax=Terrapene triunguis TaxID=2587831 RepID=A0A674KG80_9SAUR